MSYNNARRKHYRAAQKNAELNPQKGIFVPTEKKEKLLIISFIIILISFFNGILFGSYFKK